MDNVYFAVAGLGMIIIGTIGIVMFAIFSIASVVRFELAPRVAPMFARLRSETRSWVAPPVRSDAVLVRASNRPRP